MRCHIDFTYALAMELDDPGFHHSVPADFRDRLTEGGRADRLPGLSGPARDPSTEVLVGRQQLTSAATGSTTGSCGGRPAGPRSDASARPGRRRRRPSPIGCGPRSGRPATAGSGARR
ncbi:hypothetical protein ABZ590_00475 [Streptomyces hirsutus]|uniref:hypothetical protein n=1 Tax=Streptomyces hirsutus TaxID=35620 RepID=UPI0033CD62B2